MRRTTITESESGVSGKTLVVFLLDLNVTRLRLEGHWAGALRYLHNARDFDRGRAFTYFLSPVFRFWEFFFPSSAIGGKNVPLESPELN
jgi:hypothetical protein